MGRALYQQLERYLECSTWDHKRGDTSHGRPVAVSLDAMPDADGAACISSGFRGPPAARCKNSKSCDSDATAIPAAAEPTLRCVGPQLDTQLY